MSIRTALLATLVLGCHKDTPPVATGELHVTGDAADALWALAPDQLAVGIVVAPNAVALIDPALDRVRALRAASPTELAPLDGALETVAGVLGGDAAHLADAGFATDRGAALFRTEDGVKFVVLPMKDRDKLVAALKGMRGKTAADYDRVRELSCKPVGGAYTCALNEADFDRLGKGKAITAKLATAGARGDVEVYLGKSLVPFDGFDEIVATAVVANGELDGRVFVHGTPPSTLVTTPHPALVLAKPAGFVVANIAPLIAFFTRDLAAVPLPGGITAANLVNAIDGGLVGELAAGTPAYRARLSLGDPKPWQALLAHCSELAPVLPVAPQQPAGACRLVPPSGFPAAIDVWVDGQDLRIASDKAVPQMGTRDLVSPLAKDLAGGTWTYAMWGRGSLLGASVGMVELPPYAELPPEVVLAVRGGLEVSELGAGLRIDADGVRGRLVIRTIWSNPREVADKLAAIPAKALFDKSAPALVRPIADAAPTSPFATDLAGGQAGMLVPVAFAGLVSSVGVQLQAPPRVE